MRRKFSSPHDQDFHSSRHTLPPLTLNIHERKIDFWMKNAQFLARNDDFHRTPGCKVFPTIDRQSSDSWRFFHFQIFLSDPYTPSPSHAQNSRSNRKPHEKGHASLTRGIARVVDGS